MATPAQTLANQNNAALSTGPRTDHGKQKVSANATRHGLAAKRVVLATEEQAAFDELRAQLIAHYEPADDTERTLVQRLAEETWRLERCRRAETAFLDAAIRDITAEDPGLTPDQAMARLFIDSAHTSKMQLFLRYQSAIERAYNKVQRELRTHLDARYAAEEEEQQALLAAARLTPIGFVSQDGAEPSQLPPVLERLGHRDLVGELQIAPDGNAHRDSAHAHAERLQQS
jgi:hypothetical protein